MQIALFRSAPVARRLHLAFGLSATAIGLAKRAIARAHPAASRDELDLLFVEVHYGPTSPATCAWISNAAGHPPGRDDRLGSRRGTATGR